ncbi:MAG: hypothetical protein MUE59_12745, partial [Thiobacillaceae bacterium]|nr:hypothetical protein [Thiobacillaceae bacterium]
MKAGPRTPAGSRMAVRSPSARPEMASVLPSTATMPRAAQSLAGRLFLRPASAGSKPAGRRTSKPH